MEIYDYRRGNTVLAEGSHASLLCSNSLKELLSIWIAGCQPGVSVSSLVLCFGAAVLFKEFLGAIHLLLLGLAQ